MPKEQGAYGNGEGSQPTKKAPAATGKCFRQTELTKSRNILILFAAGLRRIKDLHSEMLTFSNAQETVTPKLSC